jgi:iron complex outermembrane receptor protein
MEMVDLRFGMRGNLRAGTAVMAVAVASLMAAPAFAQDATNQPGTASTGSEQSSTAGPEAGSPAAPVTVSNTNEGNANDDIVVTGSILRRLNSETPSPITTLTSESLARRGITNPADAIRSLSSDNSGSIPVSFRQWRLRRVAARP